MGTAGLEHVEYLRDKSLEIELFVGGDNEMGPKVTTCHIMEQVSFLTELLSSDALFGTKQLPSSLDIFTAALFRSLFLLEYNAVSLVPRFPTFLKALCLPNVTKQPSCEATIL